MENKISRIIVPILLASLLSIGLVMLIQLFINNIKLQKEKILQETHLTCTAKFYPPTIMHTGYFAHQLFSQVPIQPLKETISTPALHEIVRQCETELSATETLGMWGKSSPLALIIWVVMTFFTKLISKIGDDCYPVFKQIIYFILIFPFEFIIKKIK